MAVISRAFRGPALALLFALAHAFVGAENYGIANGHLRLLSGQPSAGGWRTTMVSSRKKALLTKKAPAEGYLPQRSIKPKISDTGAWVLPKDFQYYLDASLVSSLCSVFGTGSTILELGSGTGRYVEALRECGMTVHGYDGVANIKQMSKGAVDHADFTIPQTFPVADWALSLEVAEHIPPEFESIYVQNLVRHARKGMVISWAHRGQGGKGHVNCKDPHEVIAMIEGLGFKHDEEQSHMLKTTAEFEWFKKNILVFHKVQ